MPDPTLSEIDFKNKMTCVRTTLKTDFFRFGEEGLQGGGGGGGGGFGGADPNDIFRMFFGGGEGFIKLFFS